MSAKKRLLVLISAVALITTGCTAKKTEINLQDLPADKLLVLTDNSAKLVQLNTLQTISERKDSFQKTHRILVSADKKWALVASDKTGGNIYGFNLQTGKIKVLPQVKGALYPEKDSKFLIYNQLTVSRVDFADPHPTVQAAYRLPIPVFPEKYSKSAENKPQLMSMLGIVDQTIWYAVHTVQNKHNQHNTFVYTYDLTNNTTKFMGYIPNISSYPTSMEYDTKAQLAVIASVVKYNECANYTNIDLIYKKHPGVVHNIGPFADDKNTFISVMDFQFQGAHQYQAAVLRLSCIKNPPVDRRLWQYKAGAWTEVADGDTIIKRRTLPTDNSYNLEIATEIIKGTKQQAESLQKKLRLTKQGNSKELFTGVNDFFVAAG